MKYIFFLFLTANLFATAQIPDRLIYKGENYKLHTNPLEKYFENYNPKAKKYFENKNSSTALWRNYIATFEIKENKFNVVDICIQDYLKISNVDGKGNDSHKRIEISIFKDVFKEFTYEKGFLLYESTLLAFDIYKFYFLDYYTGLLIVPEGKMINYVHLGYASTYERYIIFEIKKGILTKEKQLNFKEYEQFKENQFKYYKKTENYKKQFDEMKSIGRTKEYIDDFLRSSVIEFSNEIYE